MRKLIVTTLTVLMSLTVFSQDICESLTQLKEGAHLEYTEYDKKGKALSKSNHRTTNISTDGSKVTATVNMEVQNLKGKGGSYSNGYDISCENGIIAIDMMRFFDAERMAAMGENMEVHVDGNALDFPLDAAEGKILDDGHITVSMASGGVNIMTMTLDISNRKVGGSESITTPAGTFECTKITYDFFTKMGIIKVQGSAEQWYTKDQVMVLSRTKNKKGKDLGETKLTKLEI